MANNRFRSDRERDPIAELAQLIAEADPYGQRAAPDNRFRQETASESHDEAPWVPPAPQLPADLNDATILNHDSLPVLLAFIRFIPLIKLNKNTNFFSSYTSKALSRSSCSRCDPARQPTW